MNASNLVTQPWEGPSCVARRSLDTLEDRSSIPGADNINLLVTRSAWPTLVSLHWFILTMAAHTLSRINLAASVAVLLTKNRCNFL